MKQTAALILLCIFMLLQYSRHVSYYYCLLNTATETTQCICTNADDNKNNNSTPVAPLQKTNNFFLVDEQFTEVGNHNTEAALKILNSCNYFNTGFYKYQHSSRLLRPPQYS